MKASVRSCSFATTFELEGCHQAVRPCKRMSCVFVPLSLWSAFAPAREISREMGWDQHTHLACINGNSAFAQRRSLVLCVQWYLLEKRTLCADLFPSARAVPSSGQGQDRKKEKAGFLQLRFCSFCICFLCLHTLAHKGPKCSAFAAGSWLFGPGDSLA